MEGGGLLLGERTLPFLLGMAMQNQHKSNNDDQRVICHLDLDAFYVAAERELNPALRNVPVGVSQYK